MTTGQTIPASPPPAKRDELEIAGLHVRLGDGLARPDRERGVVVRPVADALRHEQVPRHVPDGVQHGQIADALASQRVHQLRPVAAVAVALPYPPRDHPRTVSRRE